MYLLQETHAINNEEIENWPLEWEGQIFASDIAIKGNRIEKILLP